MMHSPLESLITISGLPCSGKTAGAQIISMRLHYFHYEASDLMRELYLRERARRQSLEEFALHKIGVDAATIPRLILANAAKRGRPSIVVSGLRSPVEIAELAAAAKTSRSVYVRASTDLRYKRCLQRSRADRPRSLDEFLLRDEYQRKMGIDLVRDSNNTLHVTNEDSVECFEIMLLRLIEESK